MLFCNHFLYCTGSAKWCAADKNGQGVPAFIVTDKGAFAYLQLLDILVQVRVHLCILWDIVRQLSTLCSGCKSHDSCKPPHSLRKISTTCWAITSVTRPRCSQLEDIRPPTKVHLASHNSLFNTIGESSIACSNNLDCFMQVAHKIVSARFVQR